MVQVQLKRQFQLQAKYIDMFLRFNKDISRTIYSKTCISCHFADAQRVDIGLPYFRPHRTKEVKRRRQVMKDNKNNVELERSLRLRTCERRHH